MKFDRIPPEKKKHFEPGSNEKDEIEDDEENSKQESGKDFNYLLGMKMWNLTWEKVEELKKQVNDAKKDIDELVATAPEDLWGRGPRCIFDLMASIFL